MPPIVIRIEVPGAEAVEVLLPRPSEPPPAPPPRPRVIARTPEGCEVLELPRRAA